MVFQKKARPASFVRQVFAKKLIHKSVKIEEMGENTLSIVRYSTAATTATMPTTAGTVSELTKCCMKAKYNVMRSPWRSKNRGPRP